MVELFTSQGCNACPPADRLLGKLADREDVVALSFHVDYWDYLGWRDTFASPMHTERQRRYREAWDERVIYTPQAVVQGQIVVPATDLKALETAIERAADFGTEHTIHIDGREGMLEAVLSPMEMERPCTIWIAKYSVSETVAVGRGENAGKELTYHNVVTSLDRIGDWDGEDAETVVLPQPEKGEGVAVWLQMGPGGPVLAAASHARP